MISIGTFGLTYVRIAAAQGQLGQHQTDHPDGMPILDDPRFLLYERVRVAPMYKQVFALMDVRLQCKFALQMISYSGYGLAKASVLVLYVRIFEVPRFRFWAKVMLAIVSAWTIAFFFASLFQCYPITPLVEAFYGTKCVFTEALWYSGGSTDILLDVVILSMPIPMVLRLHLPWKQKMGILAMFLLGAL